MKKIKWYMVLTFFSLLLIGCMEIDEETSPNSFSETESTVSVEIDEMKSFAETYYRMTYAEEIIDVKKVMHAVLLDDDERAMFDEVEPETVTVDRNQTVQGSMTLDGVYHQWIEANGELLYFSDRPIKNISIENAEKMARSFLERLEWESSDQLESRLLEDGSVEIECRFCYDGVKLMGDNALYFEPGNDEETPTKGFYVVLRLSDTGIYSMRIRAIPQMKDILQTYHPAEDFLDTEKLKTAIKQYIEIRGDSMPVQITNENEIAGISIDIIYMPFREAAQRDTALLIPVYEVRIPCEAGDGMAEEIILYADAITGYVYDEGYIY